MAIAMLWLLVPIAFFPHQLRQERNRVQQALLILSQGFSFFVVKSLQMPAVIEIPAKAPGWFWDTALG
jgi:hypothetical protein